MKSMVMQWHEGEIVGFLSGADPGRKYQHSDFIEQMSSLNRMLSLRLH